MPWPQTGRDRRMAFPQRLPGGFSRGLQFLNAIARSDEHILDFAKFALLPSGPYRATILVSLSAAQSATDYGKLGWASAIAGG